MSSNKSEATKYSKANNDQVQNEINDVSINIKPKDINKKDEKSSFTNLDNLPFKVENRSPDSFIN
jgi:hypothetical protein